MLSDHDESKTGEEKDMGLVGDSQKNAKRRKNVTFGTVGCRLYHRTVGLHPDVSSGPPLDFEWSFTPVDDLSLEEYESSQNSRGSKKLSRSELVIPKSQRMKLLVYECNVPRSEIASHVRKVTKAKSQRKQTINNLKFASVEEKWQIMKSTLFQSRRAKPHFKEQDGNNKENLQGAHMLSCIQVCRRGLLEVHSNFTCCQEGNSVDYMTNYSNLNLGRQIVNLDQARHYKQYDLT